jgi:hypothetical protein
MNDWNDLENQLRSWIPRPPSARVKARLFAPTGAHTAALPAEELVGPANWHWLAPAMALFVLCMFVAGKTPAPLPGFAGLSSTSLVATVAFDEPHLASYSAASHHSEANMPPVTKFVSGSGARIQSPAALPLLPTTNTLTPTNEQ